MSELPVFVKCSHCGLYGELKTNCKQCGAPIDKDPDADLEKTFYDCGEFDYFDTDP